MKHIDRLISMIEQHDKLLQYRHRSRHGYSYGGMNKLGKDVERANREVELERFYLDDLSDSYRKYHEERAAYEVERVETGRQVALFLSRLWGHQRQLTKPYDEYADRQARNRYAGPGKQHPVANECVKCEHGILHALAILDGYKHATTDRKDKLDNNERLVAEATEKLTAAEKNLRYLTTLQDTEIDLSRDRIIKHLRRVPRKDLPETVLNLIDSIADEPALFPFGSIYRHLIDHRKALAVAPGTTHDHVIRYEPTIWPGRFRLNKDDIEAVAGNSVDGLFLYFGEDDPDFIISKPLLKKILHEMKGEEFTIYTGRTEGLTFDYGLGYITISACEDAWRYPDRAELRIQEG